MSARGEPRPPAPPRRGPAGGREEAALRRELARLTQELARAGHPPDAAARLAWEAIRDRLLAGGRAKAAAGLYQHYLGATRHRGGVFYTPAPLSRYLAAATLRPLLAPPATPAPSLAPAPPPPAAPPHLLRVLDPACGAGAFLQAALAAMVAAGVPAAAALAGLYGVDLDSEALRLAGARLRQAAGLTGGADGAAHGLPAGAAPGAGPAPPDGTPGPRLYAGDALLDFPAGPDWAPGFDAVIGNPPWGAELAAPAAEVARRYSLAVDQYDSYALFIELATGLLRPGGRLGFVVPQSLLSQPNYTALRRHLLDGYDLERILNLGDGIFPGVFQPCVMFVATRAAAPAGGSVHVLPGLAPAQRRAVLRGGADLARLEQQHGHAVPAARFAANTGAVFDIYATDAEAALLARLEAQGCDWDRHLELGRGVEIGKGGQVVRCPRCRRWNNVPLAERDGGYRIKRCIWCRGAISPGDWDPADPETYQVIVHETPRDGTVPFLPGEAVGRYALGPARYIRLGFDGIQYKDPRLYRGPKILVRKTGVGLTATLDTGGHYTSQVVFILRPRLDSPLAPEYVLALLNSRLNDWYYHRRLQDAGRATFPYVTQGLLKRLLLKEAPPEVQAPLVSLVRQRLALGRAAAAGAAALEAEIDRRVAALFGVGPGD